MTLFLFTNIVFSMKLEVYSNKTYGKVSLVVSNLDNKTASLKSNSNVFGVNGDNTFGSYTVTSDLSKVVNDLKKIKSKMDKLDQTLSLSKSSLSSLYKGSAHDFYIKFDNVVVANTSPFYNKIKKQIDLIIKSDKKVIKEYKLKDSDLSVTIANKTSSSIFEKEKNCSGTAKSGVCKILDVGFISL